MLALADRIVYFWVLFLIARSPRAFHILLLLIGWLFLSKARFVSKRAFLLVSG
jgi:hypothetical protein